MEQMELETQQETETMSETRNNSSLGFDYTLHFNGRPVAYVRLLSYLKPDTQFIIVKLCLPK